MFVLLSEGVKPTPVEHCSTNTLVSNHFHSDKHFVFSSTRPRDFDVMEATGLPVLLYTTKAPIDMWHFNFSLLNLNNS